MQSVSQLLNRTSEKGALGRHQWGPFLGANEPLNHTTQNTHPPRPNSRHWIQICLAWTRLLFFLSSEMSCTAYNCVFYLSSYVPQLLIVVSLSHKAQISNILHPLFVSTSIAFAAVDFCGLSISFNSCDEYEWAEWLHCGICCAYCLNHLRRSSCWDILSYDSCWGWFFVFWVFCFAVFYSFRRKRERVPYFKPHKGNWIKCFLSLWIYVS